MSDRRKTNPQSDQATVSITVVPLFGPPVFSSDRYEFTIPITTPVDTMVYNQIRANDGDQTVCLNKFIFNLEDELRL